MGSQALQALDAVLAPWRSNDAPGLVAAVRMPDGTIWQSAAGLASVGSATPLTPTTRVRVGSVTKHFTAAVIFMLAEEHRLDLDADARQILPTLPAVFAGLSVRRLLNHTSGLWDPVSAHVVANGPAPVLTTDELAFAAAVGQDRLNFAPGHGLSYANVAYMVLAHMIEAVEGETLSAIYRRRLFGPLQMDATALVRSDLMVEPSTADLHIAVGDGRFMRGLFPIPLGGEGGVVSTVEDLLRWLSHLDAPTIFSASVWDAMRAPSLLADGSSAPFRHGVMHQRWRGLDLLFHDGGVFGGVARVMKVPSLGLDLVILANRGDVPIEGICRALIAAAASDDLDPPPPEVAAIDGDYYLSGSGRLFRFAATDGGATVEIAGARAPLQIIDGKVSGDSAETRHLRFTFEHAGASVVVEDGGPPRVFPRVSPLERSPSPPLGRYRSSSLQADVIVHAGPIGPLLSFHGAYGVHHHRLMPIAQDLWEGESLVGSPFKPLIEVTRSDGLIARLLLSTQRLHQIELEPAE